MSLIPENMCISATSNPSGTIIVMADVLAAFFLGHRCVYVCGCCCGREGPAGCFVAAFVAAAAAAEIKYV